MHIKRAKDINKMTSRLFIVGLLFFFSCKQEEKKASHDHDELTLEKELVHDVYVCPMECENGMDYYMEGKCDMCHINLIQYNK